MSPHNINFENISHLISPGNFEEIKQFVLEKGDRQTYRNFDGNNPHYKFDGFDIFFSAEIGQRNMNNDPKISDFHELVIADWHAEIRYYILRLVRKNTSQKNIVGILSGMQIDNVYLVDIYQNGLETLKNKLPVYLSKIKAVI